MTVARGVTSLPVDVMDGDWERELASPALAEGLRRWRAREPALRPFERPVALLRHLGPATPGARQDVVLCALLRCAREDPLAARLVLQTLLPLLKRRVGRVLIDAEEREELWSAVLDRVWERVRSYPVERLPHHVAANLALSAVRDELRERERWRERARGRTGSPSEGLPDTRPGTADFEARLGLDGLLAAAVKSGAVTAEEVELIARTRIDGVPLVRYASATGVAYDALRVARRRAERRLLLHLGVPDVHHWLFGSGGRNGLSVVLGLDDGPTDRPGEKTNRHPKRR